MIIPDMLTILLLCISIFFSLVTAYLIYRQSNRSAEKSDLNAIRGVLDDLDKRNQEENDLLKSNLNIQTSSQNHIYNERKNAVISYFTSLNTWMWDGLNISVQDFNHTNFEEITRRISNIKDYYNQANISFAIMQLTIDSEQLLKSGYEAMMDTLKLHHFVENTMKSYQKTLSWEKTLLDKITSKDYDFFKLSPDMKSFYERQAVENEEEKHRVLDGYNDRHWELFKQAIADRNLFRDMAKDELGNYERDVYGKSANTSSFLGNILESPSSGISSLRDLGTRRERSSYKESGY